MPLTRPAFVFMTVIITCIAGCMARSDADRAPVQPSTETALRVLDAEFAQEFTVTHQRLKAMRISIDVDNTSAYEALKQIETKIGMPIRNGFGEDRKISLHAKDQPADEVLGEWLTKYREQGEYKFAGCLPCWDAFEGTIYVAWWNDYNNAPAFGAQVLAVEKRLGPKAARLYQQMYPSNFDRWVREQAATQPATRKANHERD